MPLTTLVIINGKAGSGKDLFTNICMDVLGRRGVPCCCIHRSDPYKEHLESLGWDGEKTPEVRDVLKNLCQLGEIWGYNKEYLINRIFIEQTINHANSDNLVVFYHDRNYSSIRQLQESKKLKRIVNEITTLLVVRPEEDGLEPDSWYEEDMNPDNYERIVENTGTIDDLTLYAAVLASELGFN